MSAALSLAPAQAPQPDGNAEFSFDARDFERVRGLILARAGISLHAGKQAMVYSRLSRRLRETGHRSFGSYLQWLEAGGGSAGDQEWQAFVNCLTTNLTSFFRESHHFDALAADLKARAGRGLRIWCNAASTGEEPYTIAMTVAEALGPEADVKIVASDIDTEVLATAERAVYPAHARGLTPERQRRFFLRGTGVNNGLMRVKPELARMIEFRPHNLMDPRCLFDAPFDIVFCRNVMIYFDAATQRRVLGRIHAAMRPNSLLFVGHSENFTDLKQLFRLRGKTVSVRSTSSPSRRSASPTACACSPTTSPTRCGSPQRPSCAGRRPAPRSNRPRAPVRCARWGACRPRSWCSSAPPPAAPKRPGKC